MADLTTKVELEIKANVLNGMLSDCEIDKEIIIGRRYGRNYIDIHSSKGSYRSIFNGTKTECYKCLHAIEEVAQFFIDA